MYTLHGQQNFSAELQRVAMVQQGRQEGPLDLLTPAEGPRHLELWRLFGGGHVVAWQGQVWGVYPR